MPIVNLAILAPFPNLNLLEPLATLLSDALKFVKRRFSEISIVVIKWQQSEAAICSGI